MCKYCEYSNDVRFGANMLDDEYSEGEGYSITIVMSLKIRSVSSFALMMNMVNLLQARLILTFAPSAVGSCNRPIE